jgi:recombinational DNA repair protein (RecF pathway)
MIDDIRSGNAWLIHHQPIRDSLSLLYLLTDKGYLKGFYRHKSSAPKPLAFSPYWVAWKKNKQAINIQSLEFSAAPCWRKNLKLIVGLYLNELIYHLCKVEEPELNNHIYQAYEEIIRHPQECPLLLLRRFEWLLLANCGYAIDFTRTSDNKAIEPALHYNFAPDGGFLCAFNGWLGADIIQIAEGNWDSSNLNILKTTLRRTIDYVLDGKKLQSRDLLKTWLANQQTSSMP